MGHLSNRWRDLPHCILGITREIWEDRGIETLNRYYHPELLVRTPMGVSRGNQGVIASTMATLHEFPDRQLFGEDVIWSGGGDVDFLSSHRIISTGTHLADGWFGPASGRHFQVRIIADCAVRDDVIIDEWLVRDNGGIIRQLGSEPKAFAQALIAREGGPASASRPFSPAIDQTGPYGASGNGNEWGVRYADTLTRIMAADFGLVERAYDRAALGEHAGARSLIGARAIADSWLSLRSAFPSARFTIHHRIGLEGDLLAPRAALRWSLDGRHEGWGAFGAPTGATVHIMGMAHAEFGPFGDGGPSVRRECALWDEIAIWKQILIHKGEA